MMDPAQQMELDALAYVRPIDEATERGDSDIQRFYHDATVFLTGGTGFIGKQLIEKLFRSCEIRKAYVLIRSKKGQSTEERLQATLSDPVFEPVLKKKPDLKTRIVCVEGDVADIRLGISNTEWNTVVDEVDVIFHVAATVRFDESIRVATLTNVRGTREALRLGRACKTLRSFVHVSTAYCQATASRADNKVFEQHYESPVPPDTMIKLAETVDNRKLDLITSSLISDWPNTYTFTKAVAEALVLDEARNLPVCIIRPTIVINTYREPVPGWIDQSCVYGASGILVGSSLGVLRVIFGDNNKLLALVPVDFVNNATIAAGWETAVKQTPEANIYHISSSSVKFEHCHKEMSTTLVRERLISLRAIWYCFVIQTNNRFLYKVLTWFFHYIPAYTVDAIINVLGLKKPPGMKSFIHVYEKIDKMSSVLGYFLTNQWTFDDANLNSLWSKMSDTDRKIYNFEINSIDWGHNFRMWCLGSRKYIIKDGLRGTRRAVIRQKWFKIANYMILMIYLYVFWKIWSVTWHILACIGDISVLLTN